MTTASYFRTADWEKLIECKNFMAIHTFLSDETKRGFFGGMTDTEATNRELAECWSFGKFKCVVTCVEKMNFLSFGS